MVEKSSLTQRILYLLICAAPPAQQAPEAVQQLQKMGWDVCVIATPQATRWIDQTALVTLTGHIVRTEYKLPGEADPLPKADALLVLPATFNTINKWAQGIGDTLVTSILCEALGRATAPILAIPCLKMDLVRHPIFSKNIAFLRECGIRILHEPQRYPSPQIVPLAEVYEILREMLAQIA